MFIIFIVLILKTIKTELPKRLQKERKIWELEKNKCEYKEYKNYGINTINSNKGNLYNSLYTNNKKIDTTNVAKHFNISTKEISKIFSDLKWIEQSGKWEIATNIGIRNGAEQKYNAITKQKYIIWDEEIKNNIELINALNVFKESKNTKKEKGDKYEEHVANFFREQGYYVWEHGKEKGVQDSSIDLIIKRDEYIYFVQCKNWEKWKINHKEVKATRTDVRDYLKNNESFYNMIKNYKQKVLYVTSKECLTAGAYKYIEENSDILEYQIIPIRA